MAQYTADSIEQLNENILTFKKSLKDTQKIESIHIFNKETYWLCIINYK